MKNFVVLSVVLSSLILDSCATKKDMNSDPLYNAVWELEYMSGPRIAFEGLFPDKRPQISFNKANGEVSGNNSCNGYSAKYYLQGNNISFGEPGPTTMMYCGEGEPQFLNMIQKINKYSIDKDGDLNLMINDVPMMRFKKIKNN
ncbi:META domain-containing protein [Flavobacteriaceae bacterium F89]|uniref:META domain-containing protein n=1 Tax=Cerina litoralis TaxID=2874477 RepID=A0AAE3EYW2_9FLAO|nr:META domain-containing protein [Cerina litoralis]MCG2462262.1 META domain-containing protein [Cerina litoralis]